MTRAQPRPRTGATLLELLVAMPLGALLGVIAVALLLDTQRLTRRLSATTEIARELRHAGAVLSAELRPLSAAEIVAWRDTMLELDAIVGSGTVCHVHAANIIDLLPLHAPDALRASWFATPQPGDNVHLLQPDPELVPHDSHWQTAVLHSVTNVSTSACSSTPLFAGGNLASHKPVRLTLASATAPPEPGTPVRLTRRIRYSLYKASDNRWYLGRKTLSAAGWDVIQPVAGPLATPQAGGLNIHVRDSTGQSLPPGDLRPPQSVALNMRALTQWQRASGQPGVVDSLTLHITLRGTTRAPFP